MTGNLNVSNNIQTSQLNIKNSINNKNINFTTNNLNQSNINILSSGAATYSRDAGFDISAPLINAANLSDIGTLSIRAGTINIGNASQTSIINLNGIINTTLNGSMNITGFINQF